MKKQTIAFTTDNARSLRFANEGYFRQSLQDFGPNVKLKITVENYHGQRSPEQNKALHFWIDLIAEDCGLPLARMKEILAYKFLKRPALDKDGEMMCDESTGEVVMYVPSTADLDRAEMVKFMDEIWLWTLENRGFQLPELDKNMKINFQEEKKKQILNK